MASLITTHLEKSTDCKNTKVSQISSMINLKDSSSRRVLTLLTTLTRILEFWESPSCLSQCLANSEQLSLAHSSKTYEMEIDFGSNMPILQK